eukprot:CAMPEP_0175212920 /NCGR_PEP_ID=MMETSP0093-20121207/15925_1 /TAXON_ID=311494 /ORGANISM="Alexandrium monilatum, Strain CCMP3105" /LENGTH=386 /DNA_ID=CAMNT_0016506227 /DNA_START=81 /DNA_END=1241 /DNA_ORIENTATION=+
MDDVSPCRRLSLLADEGDAAALSAELERLRQVRHPDEVARDIATCDFGKRNSLSSLHNAALHGHAGILELLLDANADVNATDDTGNTPLHFATELGHAKAAHVLLERGADKHAKNNFGRGPKEKLAVNSWDAAQCKAGKAKIQHLLDGGTWDDMPAEEPAMDSPVKPAQETPTLLAPWMDAAADDGECLQDLPQFSTISGARVSAGRTAHVPANQYASSEISTAATLQDADADAKCPPTLAELARCGNLQEVKSRLSEIRSQGGPLAVVAEVSCIDENREGARWAMSPLHAAATAGHVEVLQVLLATRADPSIADYAGNTLLHAAAGMGNEEVVRELLEAGADPRWKNNFGKSPRSHAVAQGWESDEVRERKARVSFSLGQGTALV